MENVLVGALIISAGEPQLNRCLTAIEEQTVPFVHIVHVKDVVPEYAAFNSGMAQVEDTWVIKIDGDFVLYNNAVEIVVQYLENNNDDRICCCAFGLYDSFLDCIIGYCCAFRTSVYKQYPFEDKLSNDTKASYFLRKRGWIIHKNLGIVLGTHFDNPDEFQVFRRFYVQAIKYSDNSFVQNKMWNFFKKTEDPIYLIGLGAIDFAKKKNTYIGSHNLHYDAELFNEYKKEYRKERRDEN